MSKPLAQKSHRTVYI